MRRKAGARFTFFLVASALGAPLAAQPVEYKKVYSGDILPGYVPVGQLVETEGYLWVASKGVLFNVHPLSARAPLVIDVAGVPPETLAQIRAACTSEHPGFTDACKVILRGRVGKIRLDNYDRAGIFATSIVMQP